MLTDVYMDIATYRPTWPRGARLVKLQNLYFHKIIYISVTSIMNSGVCVVLAKFKLITKKILIGLTEPFQANYKKKKFIRQTKNTKTN